MKILHYVDENRLAWGETWIQTIKGLADQGVDNRVVCKSGGTLSGRMMDEKICCCECDIPVASLPWTALKFGRILDDWRPDIIHTRLSSAARTGGWWGRRKNIPVVSTIDKYPKAYYYKNASLIIPCSTAVRDHMRSVGFSDDKMAVVHNPVDIKIYLRNAAVRAARRKELGIPDDTLLILAAGRFVDWKGFEYAIEGYAEFVKEHEEYAASTAMCLVGDGAEKSRYLSIIEKLGMQDKIRLFGFAQDIRPWLWASDLFIQPSYEPEGFSLMLLETMAAGTPAVATNIGGTLDIVKAGENGFLVSVKNSDEIADNIFAAASNRAVLSTVSQQAAKDAANFDVPAIASRTIAIYKKVLSSAGR